ncbi:MAG: hypothetical protein GY810_19515 [Aureispira sp.]|nr:hypothetical protein [Aureispira sp.]
MQQFLKKTIFGCLVLLTIWACGSTNGKGKVDKKLLYGLWKVKSIETVQKIIGGEAMGNPQYEFTESGERIKTLNTMPAPPPEKIKYLLSGDEITYPDNPKLPAVKIAKLSKDSLILMNDKVKWTMYK